MAEQGPLLVVERSWTPWPPSPAAEAHRRAGQARLARRARRVAAASAPCVEVTHPRRAGLRLVLTGRAA